MFVMYSIMSSTIDCFSFFLQFGVTDGDGIISLWQVGLGTASNRPFFVSVMYTYNITFKFIFCL